MWTIIGQETTDDAGSVTLWVNPDYDHKLTFVSDECVGDTVTIRPTQTQYTQQLVCGTSSTAVPSNLEGIKYARTPSSGIIQSGLHNFTYQLLASKDNLVNASFYLVNMSNNVTLSSTYGSCAVGSCLMYFSYTVPEGANFYGRYYVDIGNGSFLLEGDAHWMEIEIDSVTWGYGTSFRTRTI